MSEKPHSADQFTASRDLWWHDDFLDLVASRIGLRFSNRMRMSSVVAALSPAEYGALASFWFAFEKGREKLGLGQEWVAELLPGMIVDAGFADLRVFNNDRAWPAFPPYDTEDQILAREESGQEGGRLEKVGSERQLLERCALAGGLDRPALEAGFKLLSDIELAEERASRANAFSALNAGNLHLFAARKPSA